MADCSASGTAIDRATRAIFGASGQEKNVGALFGHVATVSGGQAIGSLMPKTAPDRLALPGSGNWKTLPVEHNERQHAMMQQAQHHSQYYDMHSCHHRQQQQQHHHHAMPMMQFAQHQAMAQQAMFQQQQQQQIMQHQMQMMAAQQQALQQRNQQRQADANAVQTQGHVADWVEDQVQDGFENWHDGLEEEASKYADEEAEVLGHDGVVHGASIEELAAAWAQAETEYEQLQQEQSVEDPANLYQGNEASHVQLQPYEFINKVEENMPDMNWMDEGMRQFRNGNLKEAIRSFEMELQENNPDNATAWRMLGRCHAENDMDPQAIRCLEAAVERDPYSPEALLALGVSYVNELDHERALENIKAWFTQNPKYAGLELPTDIYGGGEVPRNESAFEEVKQLLLTALAFDATDAGDVHEALGVIYNVIKDYDAAAKSLQKALETRPDDYQLWNKLGATLANGNHSDQALPAYHRALQIKPKYARAWLNMAISHSDLQDHNEAARCYLQTLSLNPEAKHCWTYLRMALSCAEQWELLPLCFSQDLKAFQEHYDFIYND